MAQINEVLERLSGLLKEIGQTANDIADMLVEGVEIDTFDLDDDLDG